MYIDLATTYPVAVGNRNVYEHFCLYPTTVLIYLLMSVVYIIVVLFVIKAVQTAPLSLLL